jgi:hypothetical protein
MERILNSCYELGRDVRASRPSVHGLCSGRRGLGDPLVFATFAFGYVTRIHFGTKVDSIVP